MMMMKKTTILCFFCFILASQLAVSFSIGISPNQLVFDNEKTKQFTIYNPNNSEINYEVTAQDFNDLFDINPRKGKSKPYSSQRIIISAPNQNISDYIIVRFFAKNNENVLPSALLKVKVKETPQISQKQDAQKPDKNIGLAIMSSIILIGICLAVVFYNLYKLFF